MTNRFAHAALGFALVAFPVPAPAAPSATERATAPRLPIVAKGALPRGQARDLYSAHGRRIAIGYLRLKLLELRYAELDRVRAVIEGKLGVDALFSPPAVQAGARGSAR